MAPNFCFTSYSSLVIFLLPFISILFFLLKQIRNKRTSLNLPPGPIPLPILGHLHRIDRGLPHRSLFQLSIKHGPIMRLQLGIRPTLVISSARMAGELFSAVFSQRPALVSNKTLTYNFLDVALSPGNGEYWKNMKKFLVRNLLNAKTVRLFRPVREAEVWRMISSIRNCTPCCDDQPINLMDMLVTLMTTVVFVSAFDMSVNGNEEEKAEMHRISRQVGDTLNQLFIEDFVPWLRWMDVAGGFYAKLNKTFEDLDGLYERVIENHLDPMKRKQGSEDCVDLLLRIQKESNLTRDHVKAMLMVRYIYHFHL